MISWFQNKSKATACAALTALSLAVGAGTSQAADERVGDFALLDHEGYFHHMAWYDNNKAVVFLVQGNGAAETRDALSAYSELQARYADQGLKFMMINPLGEDRAAVAADVAAMGVDMPVLIDDVQAVSESIGIENIGEAVIFDPKSFRVVYRGAVGSEFAEAVASVAAGEAVATQYVAAEGTEVQYPERDITDVSYEKDVAPIIAENCASCHREGGIAPFALNNHAMVQGWSPMIREVLMTKRMPPGQIDPHINEFRNSYVVPFDDQRKVLDWIAAGSQKDGSTDPLAMLEWPPTEWAFGEPDYVIEVPEQAVPATGVLDYRYEFIPINLPDGKDRYVKASQYMAGDRTVLHHTLNALFGPGVRPSGNGFVATPDPNMAYITPYIPGAAPYVEEPNTGGLLEDGSTIAIQLHYTTTGRETSDASRIGLWFYDDDEIPEERMTGECACIFTPTWTEIPAYDPNFEMSAQIEIPADAYLHSFLPHMHFRGKYMRFDAHLPDGTVKPLINIANYNYNWQMEYKLEESMLVPAGTRIVATGAFDNSEQNKANPDPSRNVPWGDQSWDEMFFGQVYYKLADQSVYAATEDESADANLVSAAQ
ncbi:hypothetical protein PHACT_15485 [Pseudohongiella acticola]|jgi:hypothetical protein|uniref:Uncharacterized protein n=1 Tax=Pseudohongiella acticola TaxID=1524254 RepID=A0A1E8CG94_9GAMM|nr:redoxin domain-containing protein [Pseudohongiella acticola]OFE11237.1 hypothetical protein PHACT_15485 [Pseudohongiella acticola]